MFCLFSPRFIPICFQQHVAQIFLIHYVLFNAISLCLNEIFGPQRLR